MQHYNHNNTGVIPYDVYVSSLDTDAVCQKTLITTQPKHDRPEGLVVSFLLDSCFGLNIYRDNACKLWGKYMVKLHSKLLLPTRLSTLYIRSVVQIYYNEISKIQHMRLHN